MFLSFFIVFFFLFCSNCSALSATKWDSLGSFVSVTAGFVILKLLICCSVHVFQEQILSAKVIKIPLQTKPKSNARSFFFSIPSDLHAVALVLWQSFHGLLRASVWFCLTSKLWSIQNAAKCTNLLFISPVSLMNTDCTYCMHFLLTEQSGFVGNYFQQWLS